MSDNAWLYFTFNLESAFSAVLWAMWSGRCGFACLSGLAGDASDYRAPVNC